MLIAPDIIVKRRKCLAFVTVGLLLGSRHVNDDPQETLSAKSLQNEGLLRSLEDERLTEGWYLLKAEPIVTSSKVDRAFDMSGLYREAAPDSERAGSAGLISNTKKRRRIAVASVDKKAKNSHFKMGHYDDLRNRSGTLVAPLCNNATGYIDHYQPGMRYSTDNKEEESYRLLHVGVFLPFSTVGSVKGEAFYSDATSAMIAAHHFNTASEEVIRGIRPPSCDVRLTLEFFDTQESPIVSGRILNNAFKKKNEDCNSITPDVILGPRRSAVAVSTAVLANSRGIPVISHGATSSQLDNAEFFPYFGRLVASSQAQVSAAVDYFSQLEVSHINFLSIPGHYGEAYRADFVPLAQSKGIRVRAASIPSGVDPDEFDSFLKRTAKLRYWYTFAVLDTMDQYEALMSAAYRQGMIGEEFVWLLSDGIDTRVFKDRAKYESGSALEIASRGVGFIKSAGGLNELRQPIFQRFVDSRKAAVEDEEMMKHFESKISLNRTQFSVESYTRNDAHLIDPVFIYDSVVSIGHAACNSEGDQFSGPSFFDAFKRVAFDGVSGKVMLSPESASRNPDTMHYSVSFASPIPNESGITSFDVVWSAVYCKKEELIHNFPSDFEVLGVAENVTKHIWHEHTPFVYSGGTTQVPLSLPELEVSIQRVDTPYLIAGYSLGALSLLVSILGTAWTWRNRNSRVVRKSQPIFLLMIGFGSSIMAAALIPAGLQPPFSQHILDMACMATRWMYSIGFAIAFTALFAKTWRLNKIMKAKRFTRISVKPKDVCLPFVIFMILNLIILTISVVVAPLEYTTVYLPTQDEFGRTGIDGAQICLPPEHVPTGIFTGLLFALDLMLVLFTLFQNYLASSIRAEYNETFYIGLALLIVLQSWLIGIPIVYLFQVTNPNASFLVQALISTMTSGGMSITMFLPKVRALRDYRLERAARRREKQRRIAVQDNIRSIRLHQDETSKRLGALRKDELPSAHQKTERRRSSVTTIMTLQSSQRRSSRNLLDFDNTVPLERTSEASDDRDGSNCHHLSQEDLDALSMIESTNSVSCASSCTTPGRRGSLTNPPATKLELVTEDSMIPPDWRRRILLGADAPGDGSATDSADSCALDAVRQLEATSTAMFEETRNSDNGSAQMERSSLAAQERRKSSFANLTQILFGSSFSSDDEDESEIANRPLSSRATAPSMTNMLFGLGSVDEDIIEDDNSENMDERGASLPGGRLPYHFHEQANSGSSLTLESEGLVLTVLQSKKVASETG